MSYSQALLEFFFGQLHLLWILGFSVKLNHSLVLLQHALKDAHLAAVSQTFLVEVFPWGLTLLDHALLNEVYFLCPVVHSLRELTLPAFSSSERLIDLCLTCSVCSL